MNFNVETFEARLIDRGILAREMVPAHAANIVLSDGRRLCVSRYVDEDDWGVDAYFTENGFPAFCHGEGSRVTAKRTIVDPDIIAALDALAAEQPLSPV